MIDDTISQNHGNNHCNGDVSQEKNSVDTKNVDKKARIDIKIPKQSKLYNFLYVDNGNNTEKPKWKQLEQLLEIATQTKFEWGEKIYTEFVERMTLFFPEKSEDLQKLRGLVLWQILGGEELSETYYKNLRNLGREKK
ncbi:MAG: hypothetical protein SCH66_14925 [Methanolobus sp.]|nr:hypothetical protein [Methanolobus sp.]